MLACHVMRENLKTNNAFDISTPHELEAFREKVVNEATMAVDQFEINLSDAEFIIEYADKSLLGEIDEDIVANANSSKLAPDIIAYASAIMAAIVENYVRSDIDDIIMSTHVFEEEYGEDVKMVVSPTKPFQINDDDFIDTEGGWYMIPEDVYKASLMHERDFGLPAL